MRHKAARTTNFCKNFYSRATLGASRPALRDVKLPHHATLPRARAYRTPESNPHRPGERPERPESIPRVRIRRPCSGPERAGFVAARRTPPRRKWSRCDHSARVQRAAGGAPIRAPARPDAPICAPIGAARRLAARAVPPFDASALRRGLSRLYNRPELGQFPRNNRQDNAPQMKLKKNPSRDRRRKRRLLLG